VPCCVMKLWDFLDADGRVHLRSTTSGRDRAKVRMTRPDSRNLRSDNTAHGAAMRRAPARSPGALHSGTLPMSRLTTLLFARFATRDTCGLPEPRPFFLPMARKRHLLDAQGSARRLDAARRLPSALKKGGSEGGRQRRGRMSLGAESSAPRCCVTRRSQPRESGAQRDVLPRSDHAATTERRRAQ
jgi:hypothetical protein